jgi:Gluconate 2-dehydrogenase subunit 3
MTDDGFTPEEARTLAVLLDQVVPASADGRLPAAGALGLDAEMARTVQRMPMLRPVIEYGLSAIAELARSRNGDGLPALAPEERTAVVREFTATDQFFLPAFLFLVYGSYYQHPSVVEALGLEARPPHPGGYEMAGDDWTLLDPVRRRGRMYREP